MINAAAASLAGQIASALVMNGGNIGDALRTLGSGDSLRSLAASVATAGLTAEIGGALKLPLQPDTFLDYAQQSALRSTVGFGVGTTILGQGVGDALVSSGRGFVAGTVGGFAARSTGKLHLGGDINSLTQLGFHAAIGGGMGAILNGDWESGAMGGFAAEAMAKLMGSDPRAAADRLVAQAQREGLSYEDLYALQQLELQRTSAVSQFTGAVAAYLLGRDVGIAATTGLNAVENNYRGEHQDALDAAWNGAGREDSHGFEEDSRVEHENDLPDDMSSSRLTRGSQSTSPLDSVDDELAAIFDGRKEGATRESHTLRGIRDVLEQPPASEENWLQRNIIRPPSPTIESTWMREKFREVRESDAFVGGVADAVERTVDRIQTQREWIATERTQAQEWHERFTQDPSLETWSTEEALKAVGFDMWERSDTHRTLEAMAIVGRGFDQGKAYGRRALRAFGVPAPLAQDIMDGAEVVSIIMGGLVGAERAAAKLATITTSTGRHLPFSFIPGRTILREAHLIHQEKTALQESRRALLAEARVPGGTVPQPQKMLLYDASRSSASVKETSKSIHSNSNAYIGDTHVYVIRDAEGRLWKVGESMQGVNKLGLSKRAETQARKLGKQTDAIYRTELRRNFSTKLEARQYETKLIERYRRMYGKELLPGNKGNR